MLKYLITLQRLGFGIVLIGLLFYYMSWKGGVMLLFIGSFSTLIFILIELLLRLMTKKFSKWDTHQVVDRVTKAILMLSMLILLSEWKFKIFILIGAIAVLLAWNVINLLFPNILEKDKSDRSSILDAPED